MVSGILLRHSLSNLIIFCIACVVSGIFYGIWKYQLFLCGHLVAGIQRIPAGENLFLQMLSPTTFSKKKMLSPTNSSNSPIHPRIQDTGIWRIERPKGSFQRKGFWNSTNQRRNSRSSSSWHCCEKCPTHKAISSPVYGIRDGSRNFSQRRQRRIKTFDN